MINVNAIIRDILSTSKFQKLVPDMVRNRLNNWGTYADGSSIRTWSAASGEVYAPMTISNKQFRGQSWDKVTLKDTGALHKTIALIPDTTNALIYWDDVKPDGEVSDNIPDIENVFELSDEELKELRAAILPVFIDEIRNAFKSENIQNV